MGKLSRDFYDRDTVQTARALWGKYLVRRWHGLWLAGRITETEAYVGAVDKAATPTAGGGLPDRDPLCPARTAYIYLIYGMYHCLNFVTEPAGTPSAVLLRGLEAAEGAEFLARNRFGKALAELTPYQKKNFLNGPGKVCRALDLTRAQNGLDLTGDELFLWDAGEAPPADIHVGKRIGIDYAEEAVDFPWRFICSRRT